MTPETETSFDEIYAPDFEAPVESAPPFELERLEHAELNAPRAHESTAEDEQAATEKLEPGIQAVIDKWGGRPEDWKLDRSDNAGRFDGKEIFRPNGESMTQDIERTGTPEDIAAHRELLQQWTEGGTRVAFLPDHVEVTADEYKLSVTTLILSEDGRSVSYEIRETVTPIRREEEGPNSETGTDIPSSHSYEAFSYGVSAEMPQEQREEELYAELAAEADVTVTTETSEPAAESGVEGAVEQLTESPATAPATISEISATLVEEVWLEAFLKPEPLEDLSMRENAPAEHMPVSTSAAAETVPPEKIAATRAERQVDIDVSTIPAERDMPEARAATTDEPMPKQNAEQTPPQEISIVTEKTLPARESAERGMDSKSGIDNEAAIGTPARESVGEHMETTRAENVRTETEHVAQQHTEPTPENSSRERERPAIAESRVEHVAQIVTEHISRDGTNERPSEIKEDSRVDMLAYTLGIRSPIRPTHVGPDARADVRASTRAIHPNEPDAPAKRPAARVHTLHGITLRKAA